MSFTSWEKEKARSALVTEAVLIAFYVAIAWLITEFFDGKRRTFWWVIAALVVVRWTYSILEFCVGVVVWRIYLRRRMTQLFLEGMCEAEFPKRAFRHDDLDAYFARVEDSHFYKNGEITPEVQKAVAEFQRTIDNTRFQHGMIADIRMREAAKRAFNKYSPAYEAPVLTFAERLPPDSPPK